MARKLGKVCPDCQQFKLYDEFGLNHRMKDGAAFYCKPCMSAREKVSRKRRQERNAERRLSSGLRPS